MDPPKHFYFNSFSQNQIQMEKITNIVDDLLSRKLTFEEFYSVMEKTSNALTEEAYTKSDVLIDELVEINKLTIDEREAIANIIRSAHKRLKVTTNYSTAVKRKKYDPTRDEEELDSQATISSTMKKAAKSLVYTTHHNKITVPLDNDDDFEN